MYPILFHIGTVNFYTHGLMMALGALLGGAIIFYLAKKEGLSRQRLFDTLIYSFFVGIIGARILYLILYYYQFPSWYEMLLVWYGGLVSFGGIAAGFLAAGLLLRKRRENVLKWFDLGIIGFLAGWSIGKIGCLLSNDTPGVASAAKIAIWGQIPAALLESIWAIILAAILFYLFIFQKERLAKFADGLLFFLGLAGYALGRFVIDFWRLGDTISLHLKAGQIGSAVVFLGAAVGIYLCLFRFQKDRQSKGANDVSEN